MIIVGLDEVGRGCWAGPLVAAAVVLDTTNHSAGEDSYLFQHLDDSKKLNKTQREHLSSLLYTHALAIGIGWVWPQAIDSGGITAAVKLAMEQAIEHISVGYDEVIIDGNYNFLPGFAHVSTVVGADGKIPQVSAASIIAKVARDNYMIETAAVAHPAYGFEKHVGYGTAMHIRMLKLHGVTELHRQSYKPIIEIKRLKA